MNDPQAIVDALAKAIEAQVQRVGFARMQVLTETPSQVAIDLIEALEVEGFRIVVSDEAGDL